MVYDRRTDKNCRCTSEATCDESFPLLDRLRLWFRRRVLHSRITFSHSPTFIFTLYKYTHHLEVIDLVSKVARGKLKEGLADI